MKPTFPFLCLILFFTPGCAEVESGQQTGADGPSATHAAEVRTEIEEANTRINALIQAGKYEEAGQYFAPDVIQLIASQRSIEGREAWIEAQRRNALIGDWDLQLEIVDLEVRADMAVERGRGLQTFTANENSPMPSMVLTGDYIVLWKKVNDRWQIHWDYVVVRPAPEE